MSSLFQNPEFLKLFFGQSAVVIALSIWNWLSYKEKKALQRRNDELSDDLLQHTERNSQTLLDLAEKNSKQQDAAMRTIIESYSLALSQRRAASVQPPMPPSSR